MKLFRLLLLPTLISALGTWFPLLQPLQAAAPKIPAPETLGPAVKLSPYEVSAQSMEFQKWLKISSPHFVVYTDASKKQALEVVKHMEMMHQAAQFFLKRRSLNLAPVIVILPTNRSDWRKLETRTGVQWKIATTLVGSTRKILVVQYDWQEDGLNSVWAMLGLHEAAAMNLEGPLWFSRGIARFFGTVEFERDTLTIGKQGFDAYWLMKYGWLKWDRLFRVTTKSPEYFRDSDEHTQYEAQCAVFAHYLLTHQDPVWTKRFLGWAAYLAAGNESTEEAFKAVFGEDWTAWQHRLESMLRGGSYTVGNIRFPPASLEFSIVAVDFPPREMRELFVLTKVLTQEVKDSDVALASVLEHGLKTESLREILADACDGRRQPKPYLEQLRTIIAAGSNNPGVYAEAAATLFRNSAPERSLDARLGPEADEIRAWCKKALEFEPLYQEANEVLAWCEALAPSIDSHNLETIAGICHKLEGNGRTDSSLAAMAVARWRAGNAKQAKSICERLISSPLCGEQPKKIAAEILARLAGATPAAGSAAVPPP